jgi:hypothetical protein
MFGGLSLGNIFNSLIPASRFNKSGEPNRIFEEVRDAKIKFVMKNDAPLCVLLSPEMFQEIVDGQGHSNPQSGFKNESGGYYNDSDSESGASEESYGVLDADVA